MLFKKEIGPNIDEVKAWWNNHAELDKAIEALEFELIEADCPQEEVKQKIIACILSAGVQLPCDMDTFLRDWML